MGNLGKDEHTFETKSPFLNEYVDRTTKGILCSIVSFLRFISLRDYVKK